MASPAGGHLVFAEILVDLLEESHSGLGHLMGLWRPRGCLMVMTGDLGASAGVIPGSSSLMMSSCRTL